MKDTSPEEQGAESSPAANGIGVAARENPHSNGKMAADNTIGEYPLKIETAG